MFVEHKVKSFQFRWREKLGHAECPIYGKMGFNSVWLFHFDFHRWFRSDDKRFMHNHPWYFWTFVLKGSYTDVSGSMENPIRQIMKAGTLKFRPANHTHYADVPKGGAWTLLFTGRKKQKWGFFIKPGQFFRPLRYFHTFGHPACDEQ